MAGYTFSLETRAIIKVEKQGEDKEWWWVPDVKEINERQFIYVSKWDRNLVKFCLGHGLNLSKGNSTGINVEFIDNILSKRNAESQRAYVLASTTDDDETLDTPQKAKKRKKAKDSDNILVPIVEIDAPPITFESGTSKVPDNKIKVLFGTSAGNLYVEYTADNLNYIKTGVLKDKEQGKCGKTRLPKSDG